MRTSKITLDSTTAEDFPPLANLVARAASERDAAVANDPELAQLHARLPEIEAQKATAEQHLAQLARLRADALDNKTRRQSIEAAAEELLRGSSAPAPPAISDEVIRQARHTVAVADEALRKAQQRIHTRTMTIACEVVDRVVRPALVAEQRGIAAALATLFGQYATVFGAIEAMTRAGLGRAPLGNSWMPMMVFGDPGDPFSPAAASIREAVKAGALTRDEFNDAIGEFPGSQRVLTGAVGPSPQEAKLRSNAAPAATRPDQMIRVDRFGRARPAKSESPDAAA